MLVYQGNESISRHCIELKNQYRKTERQPRPFQWHDAERHRMPSFTSFGNDKMV